MVFIDTLFSLLILPLEQTLVAVVVPRWHEPATVFIDVARAEALHLATRAARQLERELAATEQALQDEELARREAWNRRWWVQLLPFLKANTSRDAIDVWDAGSGDVLPRLDQVFLLSRLAYEAKEARRVAAKARSSTAAFISVEKRQLNVIRAWADKSAGPQSRVHHATRFNGC
ncbi:hypothetical protein DIE18_02985 [Burkholderia sp. Bp9125]|nr:hypothetical protein DIE18_02985 [Burkholderia sp. Bp9125]